MSSLKQTLRGIFVFLVTQIFRIMRKIVRKREGPSSDANSRKLDFRSQTCLCSSSFYTSFNFLSLLFHCSINFLCFLVRKSNWLLDFLFKSQLLVNFSQSWSLSLWILCLAISLLSWIIIVAVFLTLKPTVFKCLNSIIRPL